MSSTKDHMLGNRTYDVLKFIAQIVLPALGTLYAAVSGLWGWPNTEEVVGTIVAVDLFLGALVGLSSISYNRSDSKFDGKFEVAEVDGTKKVTLNFEDHPDVLEQKDQVLLKVDPQGRLNP